MLNVGVASYCARTVPVMPVLALSRAVSAADLEAALNSFGAGPSVSPPPPPEPKPAGPVGIREPRSRTRKPGCPCPPRDRCSWPLQAR